MHLFTPVLKCVTDYAVVPVHQAVVSITKHAPVSSLMYLHTSRIVALLWTNRNVDNVEHIGFVKEAIAKLTAHTFILISAVVLFNASVATSSLLATVAVVIGLYAGLHGIYLVDRALAAHFYCEPNLRYCAFLNGIGLNDKPFGSGFKALFYKDRARPLLPPQPFYEELPEARELVVDEEDDGAIPVSIKDLREIPFSGSITPIDQYRELLKQLSTEGFCIAITVREDPIFAEACNNIQKYTQELHQAIENLKAATFLLIELTEKHDCVQAKANKMQDCNNLITQAHRNAKKAWQLISNVYEQPHLSLTNSADDEVIEEPWLQLYTAYASAHANHACPRLIPALHSKPDLAKRIEAEASIQMLLFITDSIEQDAQDLKAFQGQFLAFQQHLGRAASFKGGSTLEEYRTNVAKARQALQAAQELAPLVGESNNPALIQAVAGIKKAEAYAAQCTH